jgi:hypothetical protein
MRKFLLAERSHAGGRGVDGGDVRSGADVSWAPRCKG